MDADQGVMKLFNKKWKKWAVAGILLLGVAAILYGLYVYFFYTCCPEPEGELRTMNLPEMCEKAGGNYIEGMTICQLSASDAGKSCKDSDQCEGFCEIDLSSDEIIKIANGEKVEKTGTCGRWKDGFTGCFYTVENGAVDKVCAD